MKVFILAAIIATSPTLSNAAGMADMPVPTKTLSYFHHLKKMTPRRSAGLLCGGQYAKCESDSDCCAGWVCISKQCQ